MIEDTPQDSPGDDDQLHDPDEELHGPDDEELADQCERDQSDSLKFEHFVEANRIAEVFHSMSAACPEIERAIALCPDDPSYRFIAGAMLMQAQDEPGALAHFERGLMHERIGFRRGQLLLWGSRAADLCGCRARAAELRVELLALDDDYLDEHRGVARREAVEPFGRRRIELSLLLADAQ